MPPSLSLTTAAWRPRSVSPTHNDWEAATVVARFGWAPDGQDSPVFREIHSLARETHREFFEEELLQWAQRLTANPRFRRRAFEVYSYLSESAESSTLRERAAERVAILAGLAPAWAQLELLSSDLARQTTDPVALVGMAAASWIFSATRLVLLSRFGSRLAANGIAWAAETTAFVGVTHGLRAFGEHAASRSLWDEWRGTALTLGALRLVGTGAGATFRRVGPEHLWAERFFTHAGTLGGVYLGFAAETALGLREARPLGTSLVEGLALWLQFHAAGRLLPRGFGADLRVRESALERSSPRADSFSFGRRFEWAPVAMSSIETVSAKSGGGAPAPRAAAVKPATRHPRIAVIGGGLAGLFSAYSLTHRAGELAHDAAEFQAQISLFTPELGGKVRPGNDGAQFVDATHSFPLVPWIYDLGLKTFVRPDYDLADCTLYSGEKISGEHVVEALNLHRQAVREMLPNADWRLLDTLSAEELVRRIHHSRPLSPKEIEALEIRLGVEEGISVRSGTIKISALSYAIHMAKSHTPMNRLEIDGGPYRLVEALAEAITARGVKLHARANVLQIHTLEHGVRILYEQEGVKNPVEAMFDAAILAVAPEHLSKMQISFSRPEQRVPVELFEQLQAARIFKSNVVVEYDGTIPEVVTPSFASWESPLYSGAPGWKMISFFHGMDGVAPLPIPTLLREVFGENVPTVISARTTPWDADILHGAATGHRDGYTTLPGVGQGLSVAQFIHHHYLSGRHSGPLWLANHVTGCGCYMHNAALGGYLAARDLLRARGYAPREFSPHILFGIPFTPRVIEQLDLARETTRIR